MSAKELLIYLMLTFILLNVYLSFDKIKVNGNTHALYGSYGVLNTEFHSVEDSLPKVFFLGNSVYYGTSLLPELNELQEQQSFNFQIGNFGFTGASLFDYLFTYNHVKQYQPDLLVVQLNPTSFGYGGPHFRNDGKKGIFKSNQIQLLNEKMIRRLYDKDDLAEALCYSFFPLVQQSKILACDFNLFLKKKIRKYTTQRLWTFFPNKLNIVGEWTSNNKSNKSKPEEDISANFPEDSQYSTSKEAFLYFRDQLIADNQRTLFILQPSDFYNLSLMEEVEELISDNKLFTFDDQRRFFLKQHYVDKIHPNKKGAKVAARKHYKIIKSILDK